MKTPLLARSLVPLILSTALTPAAPLGTTFSFQGRLNDGPYPANGIYDFRFEIYEAGSGGSAIAGPLTNPTVAVVEGLFVTPLDFGANLFAGDARWLEIGVRTNGGGAFVVLSPRQPLSPNPYALYAPAAGSALVASNAAAVPWGAITGMPPGFADAIDNDTLFSAGAGLHLVGTEFSVSFAGSGSALSAAHSDHDHAGVYAHDSHVHSGADITSGTVDDALLSPNVALLGAHQLFLGSNRFDGVVRATNVANEIVGTFAGDGAGLGHLDPAHLSAGTAAININGTANSVTPDSIVTASLADGAVTGAKISDGSIGAMDLADNSVTSAKLASDPASLRKVTGDQMVDLGTRLAVLPTGDLIDTNLFTGLAFQYHGPTGEGAIMSSHDDGYGLLTFYTKEGPGFPIQQRMVIAPDGNVGIATNNPQVALDIKGFQFITPDQDGIVNIGDSDAYHVTLDNNELSARYRTNPSTLFLNDFGGDVYVGREADTFISDTLNVYKGVGVGIDTYPQAKLDIYGTRTIGPANDGVVNIGDSSGYHVTLDNNELHAKNGTNNSPLFLNNYGGGVWVGESLFVNPGAAATMYGTYNVQGDLRTTGLTRSGSETGTSQPPNPAGLVVRRINSTETTAGSVVARSEFLTLERDGSNGGFLIRYVASPGYTTVAAMGMTGTGDQVNRYFTLASPGTAGTVALYTDAQALVHFTCTFGRTYTSGEHLTQVTLSRYVGDWYWSGNVISTYNQ